MTYQLKVTLQEIEPPIWRRLLVPGSITFAQLNDIIQAAFGWLGYHLFGFDFGEGTLVMETDDPPSEDFWGSPLDYRDPEVTPISALLETHDSCLYTYDFGDRWRHDLVVEKHLKRSKKGSVPTCLDGARHRPPEDVGGVSGYESFLRTIRNPKDPEREKTLSWAEKDTGGRLFDPEYLYLPEINRRLAHVLEDTVEGAYDLLVAGRGLSGNLAAGWYGPVVKSGDRSYTWDRLGRMMWMIDPGLPVTIQVGRRVVKKGKGKR